MAAKEKTISEKREERLRMACPIWNRAIGRFREEIEGADGYEIIIDAGSLQDVASYTQSIESLLPRERTTLAFVRRVGPILRFVDDFFAVVALCFGANLKLTGLIWGSIRLLLILASSTGDILQNIVDMLEESSLTLPRFHNYEKTLPIDKSFEGALMDLYTEVICFYARSIHFLRSNRHLLLRQSAWSNFQGDFDRAVKRIKHMSASVESQAEIARMRLDADKHHRVQEMLEGLKANKTSDDSIVRCYNFPNNLNPRFWGRQDTLAAVKKALAPDDTEMTSLKTFAIYGMGGVGKTQIALQYIHNNRSTYDVILWIAAETTISMEQSFRESAQLLGLVKSNEDVDDTLAAMIKVKSWLAETKSRWLLVFDNADDVDVCRRAWPVNVPGAVLVTSRDFNSAQSLASSGFEVLPFSSEAGSEALLQQLGKDTTNVKDLQEAEMITQELGGLPLALIQIGGFISQRKLALKDFISLYKEHEAKIIARNSGPSDYQHTLNTVWSLSLNQLSEPSRHLQMLLAFTDPEGVHEEIFLEGSRLVEDPELEFLGDTFGLGDAEEVLLQTALMQKSSDTQLLSTHRLIQAAVIRQLDAFEKSYYCGTVVQMLTWGFPDTWSKDVGHQFTTWPKCAMCLPHVYALVKQTKKYGIQMPSQEQYGELLLRCSWYLYEREYYDIARELALAALDTFPDRVSLAFAGATDLVGLIDLDMARPEEALPHFQAALDIRREKLGPENPLLAFSLNNLALAYTEIPDLEKAYAIHLQAIDMRLKANSDRIGNSYSNMCSLLLRMGRPDEAEEMLMRCPLLKDLTDETFLNTGNPRFVGDMVILSRIRAVQGRYADAVRLASKALDFRRRINGARLKTCDSLYDVAKLLHQQDQSATSVQLLTELTTIAETLPEGQGQLARACFQLSKIQQSMGREKEAEKYSVRAREIRAKLRPEAANAPFEENSFQKFCLWMLW